MNIAEAADQVRGAVEAYLLKNADGGYCIPFEMQRPLMLMGPPGVGKTSMVAQVASEMGIGFVSYSITHHTRQSALGLPYIQQQSYDGEESQVSRYTMSEIIAAVHDCMQRTGVREGILFLDEVNCVSETLAPAMLQFLQYKTFGQHRLPQGWVVVTAGNPPEYNRSAHEFDSATLDRLKRIDVEAQLDVWIDYAGRRGIHPAIITYLQSKPQNFYSVRAGVKGTRTVTARGWEDLSMIVRAYEQLDRQVDRPLVVQYLQDDAIADDFALYYQLFSTYRDDYKVGEILAGQAPSAIEQRARQAAFPERMVLVGLLCDAACQRVRQLMVRQEALALVRDDLLQVKTPMSIAQDPLQVLDDRMEWASQRGMTAVEWKRSQGDKQRVQDARMSMLRQLRMLLAREGMLDQMGAGAGAATQAGDAAPNGAFASLQQEFNSACEQLEAQAVPVADAVDNALEFMVSAFGDGDELVVAMTRMTADPVMVKFQGQHGGPRFLALSDKLMLRDRTEQLLQHVRTLRDQQLQ